MELVGRRALAQLGGERWRVRRGKSRRGGALRRRVDLKAKGQPDKVGVLIEAGEVGENSSGVGGLSEGGLRAGR